MSAPPSDAPRSMEPAALPTRQLLSAAAPAVVTVRGSAAGAGFIVDPAGYIVTTTRVVGETTRVEVTLSDGRTLPVTRIGRDVLSDLAVLKVEASGLPALPLGESSALRVGEPVLAVGAGRRAEPRVTTISATGLATGGNLATDAPLGPERAGGPLLNVRGQVVGVAGGTASPTAGFALPIDRAKPILADLKAGTRRVLSPFESASGR